VKTNHYVRYGEAFKQQVVEQIQSGKFSGAFAASRAYGIKGSTTVNNWLRLYGREDLIAKQITITTVQEKDRIKQLEQRNRQLEKALATTQMKGLLEESYLRIACERLEMEVDEFKKKHDTQLSQRPGRKAQK
jgi:transposase-like protein